MLVKAEIEMSITEDVVCLIGMAHIAEIRLEVRAVVGCKAVCNVVVKAVAVIAI